MKFDLEKRTDRGTRRTLATMREVTLSELEKKPLEKISISEFCELADIPRATFYNYFLDKYDLIDYVWYSIHKELMDGEEELEYSFSAIVWFLGDLFDYIDENREMVKRILSKNPEDGALLQSFQSYFLRQMTQEFEACPHVDHLTYSPALTAQFCSMALLTLISRKIAEIDTFSKEDAVSFLLSAVNYEALGMVYEPKV